MTYNQFLNGNYWRPIKGFKHHIISNKGKVRNLKTGNFIKNKANNVIQLTEDGKTAHIVLWQEVLKAFPDVEFTTMELRKFCANSKIKRGVYKYDYPSINNKRKIIYWRSIISFQGEKKFLGYYKTKNEALQSFSAAFLMLRGFKPW